MNFFITIITILCFLVVLVFCSSIEQESESKSNTCQTSECSRVASFVLQNLNTNIDPCYDFYEFVCGNFGQANNIGNDEDLSIPLLLFKNSEKKRMQLVTEKPLESESKHLKVPNAFYNACMNAIDLPTKPITEIMNLMGGWPVLRGDNWNSDGSWSWQETLKKLVRFGVKLDAIFKTSVLLQGSWSVSVPKIYDYDEQIENLSIESAVQCGANETQAKIEYQQVFEFERSLGDISAGISRNISMNIEEMQTRYPYMDWLNYFNAFMPNVRLFNKSDTVYVENTLFFENLRQLLRNTSNRTIANYFAWKLHMQSFPKLKMLRTKKTNLSEFCLWETFENFATEITSFGIRKYLNSGLKDVVKAMVENIMETFSQILPDVAWMDETTRKDVQERLQNLGAHIGYEENDHLDSILENYYQGVDINVTEYFYWVHKIELLYLTATFRRLISPRFLSFSIDLWSESASYSLFDNSIIIPFGITQEPVFNPQWPNYINYGSTGHIIAHEVSHGLIAAFEWKGSHILECITKQFENYTDPITKEKLNLSQYQNENNADNGGLKAAYHAYKNWVTKNGPELTLPGLNYTAEQLFWISAGQRWCQKFTTENHKKNLLKDSHSPGHLRVSAMMSNVVEFSKDFQCQAEAKMNPAKKCLIF